MTDRSLLAAADSRAHNTATKPATQRLHEQDLDAEQEPFGSSTNSNTARL